MSFLTKLSASLPFGKREADKEYFFAINIGLEKIVAALWVIEGKKLNILDTAIQRYASNEEILTNTDQLLDQVLGLKEVEPQKILFGVPDLWLVDDNLKDEYLKTLRTVVKELELTPMAYVATSHAIVHFLEKQEGIPVTAILIGFEKNHLTVTVVRAGKIDGVKVVKRGESAGSDIEKALLAFTDVETLPSKILIYGEEVTQLKSQLMSFPWMSKLSFLHFPKIDILEDDLEIKSVCLAGGSEIASEVIYIDQQPKKHPGRVEILDDSETKKQPAAPPQQNDQGTPSLSEDDFGFVVGDVSEKTQSLNTEETEQKGEEIVEKELAVPQEHMLEIDDFAQELPRPAEPLKDTPKKKFNLTGFFPKIKFPNITFLAVAASILLIIGTFIYFTKAEVKIFVEPKILEKDAQVVADSAQKTVDEDAKIIPAQIVEIEVSGSSKDTATGKRQIGDPAKGTIIIYNKTAEPQSLSKGTQISGGGTKFTLDTSVTIASQSASDSGIAFGKSNTTVTAANIGADGNLPSGSELTIANYSKDKLAAKAEGNFSGGTSKDVTVVSNEDQQKLLAKLSSDLKKQAQQKLQEKYPDKKILEEALSENIIKKSYNKNINDQASEFSLNMTVGYKGTAFDDADLKTIVSKLVTTQVPDGFQLDIAETETQADVSKLEKSGKLVFLARFKAKLTPKIDTEKIKDQIIFKTPAEAREIIKNTENILDSEIKINPNLPEILQRLPLISKNIKIEVGLK